MNYREYSCGMEPLADNSSLTTEERNENSLHLDTTQREILTLINAEDHKVAPAVAATIPQITEAVDLITSRLKAGDASTWEPAPAAASAFLDVAEVKPTFGVGLDTVEAIMGGAKAITESVERPEDDFHQGGEELKLRGVETMR